MKTRSSLIFENFISENDLRFDRLVSPKKAAELLDVSVKFVYESIARREIQSVKVGGRLRRIRLSTLETWLSCKNQER